MPTTQTGKARFDAQLPLEQKYLFEQAASVGGFRSLTDFVLSAAQKIAEEIIAKNDAVLASERDREVFFDALINPPEPNAALRKAAKQYQELSS